MSISGKFKPNSIIFDDGSINSEPRITFIGEHNVKLIQNIDQQLTKLEKRIEELESDNKILQDSVTDTMHKNADSTAKVYSLEGVIDIISESINSLKK